MTPGLNSIKIIESYRSYAHAKDDEREKARKVFNELLVVIADKISQIDGAANDTYLKKLSNVCSAIIMSGTIKRPMYIKLLNLLDDTESDKIGFERITYTGIDITALLKKLNLPLITKDAKKVNTYLTAGNSMNKVPMDPITIYTRDDLATLLVRRLVNTPMIS